MGPEGEGVNLKATGIGALAGAGLFAFAGLYQSAALGEGLWAHLQPVAFLAVLGGTVGGLAGPLVGAILGKARRRGRGE